MNRIGERKGKGGLTRHDSRVEGFGNGKERQCAMHPERVPARAAFLLTKRELWGWLLRQLQILLRQPVIY